MKCFYTAIERYINIFYDNRGKIKGVSSLINCLTLCNCINILVFKEDIDKNKSHLIKRLYRDYLISNILKNTGEVRNLFVLQSILEKEIYYFITTAKKLEKMMLDSNDTGVFLFGKWRPGLIGTEVIE